jgi:hypothetical protein
MSDKIENYKMAMAARLEMFKSATALATEAIKTAALVSGGAAVAAMALVGQTAGSRPQLAGKMAELMPLFWFALLFSAVASATAYLAQWSFQRQHESFDTSDDPPYLNETTASCRWGYVGLFFRLLTMALITGAYGLLLWAFLEAGQQIPKLLATSR